MISVLVNIKDSKEDLKEYFSNFLSQDFGQVEIFCIDKSSNNSSLSSIEEFDNKIKLIDDYDDFLKESQGDYILFLDFTQNIKSDFKEEINNIYENNLELFVSMADIEKVHMKEYLNKQLSNLEIDLKFLFKNLDNDFFLFVKKSFLKENSIQFIGDNSLFLLNCICLSKKFLFSDKCYLDDSAKSDDKLNINDYYKLISTVLSNKEVYNYYFSQFWNYIFGKLFDIIYYLRNEQLKRSYFMDSKTLFNRYCFDEGYYEDIYDSVDGMVLEFFKQSLIDVCYIPKKREVVQRLIKENFKPIKVSIKSNNHNIEYEKRIKKYLEKKGFKVVINQKDDWYDDENKEDIVLVLRSSECYTPHENHVNVIWNIYDEDISIEEYDSYDVVFISSKALTKDMDKKLDGVVKRLAFDEDYKKENKIKEACEDIIETLRNFTF